MTTQISFQLACLFEREVKDFDRKIEEKVISCFSHTCRTGNDSAHAPARLEKEIDGYSSVSWSVLQKAKQTKTQQERELLLKVFYIHISL